jgi:hypothetical protein
MYRGSTPRLEFVLPFDTALIAECYVTIAQNEEVKVEKEIDDCVLDGHKLSVTLAQEDTLELDANVNAEIQIRAVTATGNSLVSDIYCVDVGRILKEGAI